MTGAHVTLLRRVVALAVTVGVAWAIWRSQCMVVEFMREDRPFFYPPSGIYTDAVTFGWPVPWLVRSVTHDIFSRTTIKIAHDVLSWQLACNLVVWISILASTLYVTWRASGSRAQFRISTLFSTCAAVAIILSWWRIEYNRTYFPDHPELTRIIRELTGTPPFYRLLKCGPFVSAPILAGVFCLLLQINAWLAKLVAVGFALCGSRLSASGVKEEAVPRITAGRP